MASSKFRRGVTGVALAGAVVLGGLTVAALNPLTSAGAQDGATTTTAPPASPAPARSGGARSKVVTDALKSLVDDGTLTRAQADTVQSRLQQVATTVRGDRKANRQVRRQDLLGTAATALGITPEALKAELKSGKTVKAVAQANNVDPQKVTDALVTETNKLIDQAVNDNKISQAKGDTLKQKASTRISRFVEQGGRRVRNGG